MKGLKGESAIQGQMMWDCADRDQGVWSLRAKVCEVGKNPYSWRFSREQGQEVVN